MRIVVLALAFSFTLAFELFADTVVLKSGQALDGKILKNDAAGIELEVEYGTVLIAQDKILRIEAETPELSEAREKKAVESRELADKMRADGKVLYKGKWVGEKEKKAEDDKIAATKKKKADEVAAKRKAQEESDRKKREENQRLTDERVKQDDQLAQQNGRRNARDGRSTRNTRANAGDQIDDSSFERLQNTLRRAGVNGGQIDQVINNTRRRN